MTVVGESAPMNMPSLSNVDRTSDIDSFAVKMNNRVNARHTECPDVILGVSHLMAKVSGWINELDYPVGIFG